MPAPGHPASRSCKQWPTYWKGIGPESSTGASSQSRLGDSKASITRSEAAQELRKPATCDFRDSDQYRALDEMSRSRLETVVEDLAQLERALDSFMKDHEGAPPEKLEELVPKYIDRLPEDPFSNPEEKIPDYLNRHQCSLGGRGYLYLQKPNGTSIKSYDSLTFEPSQGAWQIQASDCALFHCDIRFLIRV